VIPNIDKLKEMVVKLQKIMRIQDWDISIELLSAIEMSTRFGDCTTMGYSFRNIKLNTATISINKDNLGGENEWYATLVHELFHVQSTMLMSVANAYFQKEYEYFETIYESHTEKLAQMFITIYPVTNFIKEGENNAL
jgi:hypothetical protein